MNTIAATPQEKATQRQRIFVGVVVFFGLVGLMSLFTPNTPTPTPPTVTSVTTTRTNLPADLKDGLALLINIHSELCATVNQVTTLGNNTYEVACTRYRDGTGTATYEVNLSTGQVK